jgi:cyclopropane-fatty-acyl-phospholipid synthase
MKTLRQTFTVASRLTPILARLDPEGGRDRPFALRFWDGSEVPATSPTPSFRLDVRDPAAIAHILRAPGELGVARAWVSGALDLEGDLEHALRTIRDRLEGNHAGPREIAAMLLGAASVGALRRAPVPESEARVSGGRHSLRRDRVAVRHHYDVPTAFYRLVLGPSLVYSCAIFRSPDDTLEEAQERKLDTVCRKLALEPGERFLDIGCGWGSLILHAAQRYGVRATGVTLSPEQAAEARRRIAEAGLEDRCAVHVMDYRELDDDAYDAIASVGMYEHVGRDELGTYVRRLRDLLRPGGRLLNHGITRTGADDGRPIGPFIDRYVFPDGELHPLARLLAIMEADDLEVRHVETLREHYPPTLRRWVANLEANREEAIRLAGIERERIWRLYMTASAIAFDKGDLAVYQTLATRPERRPAHPVGGNGQPPRGERIRARRFVRTGAHAGQT